MGYIKLVQEQYPRKGDVIKLAYYIGSYSKCKFEISGGLHTISNIIEKPHFVAEQFLAVQYGENFQRRLYHLVVSFDSLIDSANLMFAKKVGDVICNMYPDYQSAFAVHENTANLHLHIMFNNCPIVPEKPKLSSVFNILAIDCVLNQMIDAHLGIIH